MHIKSETYKTTWLMYIDNFTQGGCGWGVASFDKEIWIGGWGKGCGVDKNKLKRVEVSGEGTGEGTSFKWVWEMLHSVRRLEGH